MESVFLKLVNMSIAASFMIAAVVVLRVCLKKSPKALRCVLWALVGIRLICPFSLESVLSLIPSAQTIPDTVLSGPSFSVQTGFENVDTRVNAELASRYYEGITVPTDTGLHVTALLSAIWLIGIFALAAYAVFSFIKLRKQTAEALPYRENIYLCDRIPSPFILGVLKPRIFLPASMKDADIPYVLAHEQAHLKRRDHLWKPLGFALLCIYWFNPLIWVAYILLCRDIELACDEKVIKAMGADWKKPYADALINCSVSQKRISACPVAFGETDVKGRIQSVLQYKKPAFWVLFAAVIASATVAVCFLTVPKGIRLKDLNEVDGQISSVTVITERGSYEITEQTTIVHIYNFLNEMRVSKTAISGRRDENRDKSNTIILHYTSEDTDEWDDSYFFSSDCTEVWLFDRIKPTLTHSVKDPQAVRQFFENQGATTLEGLSLQLIDADFSTTNPPHLSFDSPYITIEWINATAQDLNFGAEFCIYRETNGSWEKLQFPENYGFNAYAILLPAHDSEVKSYNLQALDINRPGKYKFESSCFKDIPTNSTEYRQVYTVSLEFVLTESEDGTLVCQNVFPYQIYIFRDSVDQLDPIISLSTYSDKFEFTYSVFSSYIPIGTYEWSEDILTLRTDDGENVYVFKAQENGLVFDAAQSSPIPQYKYSGDAQKTQSPVPDGAVFQRSQ